MQASSLNESSAKAGERLKEYTGQRKRLEDALVANENELRTLREAEAAAKKESEHNSSELAKTREEMQSVYDKTVQESQDVSRKGMSKEKYEESKRLANELGDLKIKVAEANKENAMLKQRRAGPCGERKGEEGHGAEDAEGSRIRPQEEGGT